METTPRSDDPMWNRLALLAPIDEQTERADVPGGARLMLAAAAAALRTEWQIEEMTDV